MSYIVIYLSTIGILGIRRDWKHILLIQLIQAVGRCLIQQMNRLQRMSSEWNVEFLGMGVATEHPSEWNAERNPFISPPRGDRCVAFSVST